MIEVTWATFWLVAILACLSVIAAITVTPWLILSRNIPRRGRH